MSDVRVESVFLFKTEIACIVEAHNEEEARKKMAERIVSLLANSQNTVWKAGMVRRKRVTGVRVEN